MSGGFFRGTSADQDTRFSNKQAKLLKSQKFAPELENLVDMTKVKIDVMKPWIAKRVTELIGFEDEVLINFIYGLLEGKAVNGKQVQIQLTGFMERSTGKFMKELWMLLLSAQQNVSGVPQPFLDAKEEESKKKKVESDRIANENRMKKEKDKKDLEQEKTRMDNDGEMSREKRAVKELDPKHELNRTADPRKDGSRGRSRGSLSSESGRGSPPTRRKHSISPSKSPSSRSHSEGRQRSRSIRRGTRSRSRSVSSERPRRTWRRRSVTPRGKYNTRRSRSRSPLGRRPFYSNRGSVSPTRRRSPSPRRNRIRPTLRYRSRSPLGRRSRSPIRRRSRTPPRYRSRSPVRHRSPSPVRRRSPPPARRRSPSPVRSPSLSGSRSPSPVRRPYRHTSSSPYKRSTSPIRHRPSMQDQKRSSPVPQRSPSPQYSSSQSPIGRSSLSPSRRESPRRVAISSSQSPAQRTSYGKHPPARQASRNERSELPKNRNGSKAVERKPTAPLKSPQMDVLEQHDLRRKERDSPRSAPKVLIGAEGSRDTSYSKGGNKDDEEKFSRREIGDPKYKSSGRACDTPIRPKDSAVTPGLAKSRKTQMTNSDGQSDKMEHRETQDLSTTNKESSLSEKGKDTHESQPELSRLSEKNGLTESPPKKIDDHSTKVKEKRKHKRSDADSDDYSSNDSYGERREAKKRRKEEKKLKKQERRKRREERRLRKEEKREEKLKLKAVDPGSSSSNSEGDHSLDTEAEKKRIEIELREKALESLRAKRGIGN